MRISDWSSDVFSSDVEGGVNRVILATDCDFNVGTVDQGGLETLVADQRKAGIALTTLGFGRGNYNDALAEQLADIGDGNHAYIDSLTEARQVLVQQVGSTLLTIPRHVKIRGAFTRDVVREYRVVRHENGHWESPTAHHTPECRTRISVMS